MILMRMIGSKARQPAGVYNLPSPKEVPDEEALCLANPYYSCVTCKDADCPDFGTRFASCPDHKEIV